MPFRMKKVLAIHIWCFIVTIANAQSVTSDEYWSIANERAGKIAAALNITDSTKFYKVKELIAKEYVAIKEIDERKVNALTAIKTNIADKNEAEIEKTHITTLFEQERALINKQFVAALSTEVSPEQIEQIKNGMTYNVLPITYKGYLEMIPRLTEEEREYIYAALVEAREHAMAAGSSKEKHEWFGKYKGRINNFLSARGYDMNKESKDWQERIKQQNLN